MTVLAQAAEGAAAGGGTAEIVLFWIFGVLALGAAIAVVTMRNIVHAALMLVLNLISVAGLYLTLESAFLSVIQILVYAGAIMVIFLFVIMLLGVDRDDLLLETHVGTRVLAVAGGALLAGALLFAVVGPYTGEASRCGPEQVAAAAGEVDCAGLAEAKADGDDAGVAFLGERMFTRYTLPFELAALLLTVATIGAVLLARRRDLADDDIEDLPPVPGGPEDLRSEGVPGSDPRAVLAQEEGSDVRTGDLLTEQRGAGAGADVSGTPEFGDEDPDGDAGDDDASDRHPRGEG